MEKLNKILIITLCDCESCKIATNNILHAVQVSHKNIEVTVSNKDNFNKDFLRVHHIDDYPTILCYKGFNIDVRLNHPNSLVYRTCGSDTLDVYSKMIDSVF